MIRKTFQISELVYRSQADSKTYRDLPHRAIVVIQVLSLPYVVCQHCQ
jgi:hypothetical protein